MTPYETLGVLPTATASEITAARRGLARLHHPDRVGGDADKMMMINAATELLLDPAARAVYDKELALVTKPEKCSECGGHGMYVPAHSFAARKCPRCKGRGRV